MTKAQSAMHSFDSTGTSTTTRTTASSEEPVSRPLLLTCIRVLRLHFEHGGLDQTGYDVLYRMIQMMPATGWETHVAITSSAPPGDCSTKMERYAGCIPQGCQMSSHNMQIAAEKALQAVKSLPELNGNVRVYREWARTLRTLHKPTGNDRRLFELMLNHFNDVAYQRVVQLDICKPQFELERVFECARSVVGALEDLQRLAKEADGIVCALDRRFEDALVRLPQRSIESTSTSRSNSGRTSQTPEILPSTVYDLGEAESSDRSKPHLSKSFSDIEAKLGHRVRGPMAVLPKKISVEHSSSKRDLIVKQSHPGQGLAKRRKGTSIPRIFTGSFTELESGLRELQVDEAKMTVTHSVEQEHPIQVRDVGNAPDVLLIATNFAVPLQDRKTVRQEATTVRQRCSHTEAGDGQPLEPLTVRSGAQPSTPDVDGLEVWLK